MNVGRYQLQDEENLAKPIRSKSSTQADPKSSLRSTACRSMGKSQDVLIDCKLIEWEPPTSQIIQVPFLAKAFKEQTREAPSLEIDLEKVGILKRFHGLLYGDVLHIPSRASNQDCMFLFRAWLFVSLSAPATGNVFDKVENRGYVEFAGRCWGSHVTCSTSLPFYWSAGGKGGSPWAIETGKSLAVVVVPSRTGILEQVFVGRTGKQGFSESTSCCIVFSNLSEPNHRQSQLPLSKARVASIGCWANVYIYMYVCIETLRVWTQRVVN